MTGNPGELTIKKFHEGLVSREFSAREAIRELYKTINAKDITIQAYLSLNPESAEEQAEAVDAAITCGEKIPLFAGVPLAIKDNILVSGEPATAASRILASYTAPYNATVIEKLRAAKAIVIGKTNLDEFACGSSTENSAFHSTKNPRDFKKVPGGSSGGSAAAVAGDMAVAALGSDTGGSIRLPADFCRIVGLKPTYGAVSRYGLIAMASSLDQIGPLAKTVEDAALLFNVIQGQDPQDATSADTMYGDELINPKLEHVREMTIGLPKEYYGEGITKKIQERMKTVIAAFKNLKIKFKEVSLPHTKYALAAYYIIMPAEVSANVARFDGIRYALLPEAAEKEQLMERYVENRSRGFGAEVKRRIMLGAFVLSSGYYDAYYAQAQKVRTLVKRDFEEVFRTVDALLTPVSPTLPFAIGEKIDNPLTMYLSDIFTVTANVAGVPALVVPPGFQLIGKPWHEADILGLGQLYERMN